MATLLALWLAKRGNGRNSKTKHRFDKIFGTDAKWMCVYKTMSPDSGLFFFSNLNYVVKLPDWPVTGYHDNLPPKYG